MSIFLVFSPTDFTLSLKKITKQSNLVFYSGMLQLVEDCFTVPWSIRYFILTSSFKHELTLCILERILPAQPSTLRFYPTKHPVLSPPVHWCLYRPWCSSLLVYPPNGEWSWAAFCLLVKFWILEDPRASSLQLRNFLQVLVSSTT